MFEWDEVKRAKTLHDRQLDFADVWQIFDGRAALHVPSSRNDEDRFASTAEINGALYTVIWLWRGGNRRIVSLRRARNGEERSYHKVFG